MTDTTLKVTGYTIDGFTIVGTGVSDTAMIAATVVGLDLDFDGHMRAQRVVSGTVRYFHGLCRGRHAATECRRLGHNALEIIHAVKTKTR